jgi:hypothetical protein
MTEVLEKPATKKKAVSKRKKTTAPRKPVTKKKTPVKKPTKPKTTRKKRPSKAQQEKQDKQIIENVAGQTLIVDESLEADLGTPAQPQEQLEIIRAHAQQAVKLLRWIEKAEDLTKERKADYDSLVRKDIPEKMLAIQLDSFTLNDGSQISVKDIMSGSLPKAPARKKEAIEYLKELGAEGLLKPSINIQLTNGEETTAKRAISACKRISSNKKKRDALVKAGISLDDIEALKVIGQRAEIDHTVHHSTLASFGREVVSNGVEFEPKKLGLFGGKIAKINLSKEDV